MSDGHLALVGPTASGKSAVALALARRVPGLEIVVVDSMQVYRGMDIGTAKPTREERAEVPHHLIDLAEPTDDFSVACFQAAFRSALADIESRAKRALLVAGTGLYLRAAIDGFQLPGEFSDARAELDREPDTTVLHERLAQLDPVAASRMEPGNRRRVLRALEVTVGSGRPFSSFGPGLAAYPPTPFRLMGLDVEPDALRHRIATRFDHMVQSGLVDEVRALPQPLSRTARYALGYREVLAHIEHGLSLREAAAEAVRRTRSYARRQRVWFRRDPRVRWYDATGNPLAVVPDLLGDLAAKSPC